MDNRLVNVGFGNAVKAGRVLAVANPGSSPLRKLKDEARREGKLIDMTEGRRTRAVLILDSGHLVLSAVQPETIRQRFEALTAMEALGPARLISGLADAGEGKTT